MKTINALLITMICLLMYSLATAQKKVIVTGHAVVGIPGQGDSLLTLNSERPWIFRQYDTGPSTALELFSTIGLKNFIINSTGNVGIDVLMPNEKLHVNGSIKAIGPRISFGSAEYIEDGGGFIINANGSLISVLDGTDDLGRSANRWRTIYATNGVINTSDARSKKNIQPINYGLKDLLKLKPISFQWKNSDAGEDIKLGLLAQDLLKVIPEVVNTQDSYRTEDPLAKRQYKPAELLGVYYSDLIPVLIKSIQEQQEIINNQQQRIADLEAGQKIILQKIQLLLEQPKTLPR